MRVSPASVYRNLLYLAGGSLFLYAFYSIVAFDDGAKVHTHRRQKHLFLTVSQDRIGDRFGVLAPKKILYWTTVFNSYLPEGILHECRGIEDRCLFVKDKSLISSVDAVFFHSTDLTANPKMPNPRLRNSSQIFVYSTMETPENSGLTKVLRKLPAGFFNWTMTPLHASDVLWKYGSFWIPNSEAERKGYSITSYHVDRAKLKKSKKGIVGLISNCRTDMLRENAVQELAKYMDVTIGGKCAPTNATRDLCPHGQNCDAVLEEYPFFFALENSICTDYVTEKYWTRYSLASVPIVAKRSVMKSSNPPPKSFIALDDYKSPKEMAEHLKYLESNQTAYAEYFAWRMDWTTAPWMTAGYRNGPCALCEKLWEKDIPHKSYENVFDWYEKESHCDHGEFVKKWIAPA